MLENHKYFEITLGNVFGFFLILYNIIIIIRYKLVVGLAIVAGPTGSPKDLSSCFFRWAGSKRVQPTTHMVAGLAQQPC